MFSAVGARPVNKTSELGSDVSPYEVIMVQEKKNKKTHYKVEPLAQVILKYL